jgi:hypothetical protein
MKYYQTIADIPNIALIVIVSIFSTIYSTPPLLDSLNSLEKRNITVQDWKIADSNNIWILCYRSLPTSWGDTGNICYGRLSSGGQFIYPLKDLNESFQEPMGSYNIAISSRAGVEHSCQIAKI